MGGLAVGLSGVALLVGVESVSSLATFLGSLGILLASACYAGASYVAVAALAGLGLILAGHARLAPAGAGGGQPFSKRRTAARFSPGLTRRPSPPSGSRTPV